MHRVITPTWTPPPEFGNDPDSVQLGTQWSEPSFSLEAVASGVIVPMEFPGYVYTVGFDAQRGAHKIFSDKVTLDIEKSRVYRQLRGFDHPNPEMERTFAYQNKIFPKDEVRRMVSLLKVLVATNT